MSLGALVRGDRTRAAVRELWARGRGRTAELGADLLRGGDGSGDAHGPDTAGTDGDVDAKDASEEGHPGESMGCGGTQLRVEHGGNDGKLEGPMRDEQGELLEGGCSSGRGMMREHRA